jgi:hypothetical protein
VHFGVAQQRLEGGARSLDVPCVPLRPAAKRERLGIARAFGQADRLCVVQLGERQVRGQQADLGVAGRMAQRLRDRVLRVIHVHLVEARTGPLVPLLRPRGPDRAGVLGGLAGHESDHQTE